LSSEEHFRFVQELAADLNRKQVKLPSFPDVVMRIRKALDCPDTTASDLANILSNDAVLASRVLMLANSTYHNPAGIRIESLDAAVGRIGFEQVRTASISYAVEQLYASEDFEPLKNELRQSWAQSVRLAAMSEVIARSCTQLDCESAFVAGLLNRIGDLAIYMKYPSYPTIIQNSDARQHLLDEWSAPIGESIVEHWGFSEEIAQSVNPDDGTETRRRCEPTLADVVSIAKLSLNGSQDQLGEIAQSHNVEISQDKMPEVFELYKNKLDSIAAALA